METKFNSQVSTTIEQSKKLIELGLKSETADMAWCGKMYRGGNQYPPSGEHLMWLCMGYENNVQFYSKRHDIDVIPTWSLHRLIEICPSFAGGYMLTVSGNHVYYMDEEGYTIYSAIRANLYDNFVDCIEWLIKGNDFNEEYLK